MTAVDAARRVGIVDYFELEPTPTLVHSVCASCSARYFGRRSGCSRCGGEQFHRAPAPQEGVLRSYTIVHRAAPGVPVPFIAAVIELDDGTCVNANLRDVTPDPAAIELGGRVRLTTFVAGVDSEGTEAIGFGFRFRSAEGELVP